MSIDDRLRNGLAANGDQVESAVEESLRRVQASHRRRGRVRVGLVAASFVAVAVAAPLAFRQLSDEGSSEPARPQPTDVTGRYRVDVEGRGETRTMTGAWTVTLGADGSLTTQPPSGYDGPTAGGGETYRMDDGQLVTNAFLSWPGCQRSDPPVGRYRVTTTPSGVAFDLIDDTCPARIQFFESPWEDVS
jgi:hypothetical protein